MSPATFTEAAPRTEHRETFDCFGSQCTVMVSGGVRATDAIAALAMAKRRLLEWHDRFSRFVDPTLVAEIEQAGYASDLPEPGVPLIAALALAPPRMPAGPSRGRCWREIEVDRRAGAVTRPPGVKLDAGGIAKGVFADELAALLARYDGFVVDCAGDIRLGGTAFISRQVHVASPFADSVLHTFELAEGGIATSGIGKRSWLGSDGRPAHHLLDPGTGTAAFTGVVQATALAPTAAEAEILSKAAILSGPERADDWLRYGGVVVLDDGSHRLVV
jgi:FAD:protein FMN transferase